KPSSNSRWRGRSSAGASSAAPFTTTSVASASIVQSYGSKHLDASALLIPLVGFLPPEDPRVKSTGDATALHLGRVGLVRRYDSEAGMDGLPPGEGVFLPCSFGSPTISFCLGNTTRRTLYSSGCCRCATMSGSWQKNTM